MRQDSRRHSHLTICSIASLSTSQSMTNIKLYNSNIPIHTSIKDLGVIFDTHLTFKNHILQLSLQLRKIYWIFVKNFSNLKHYDALWAIYGA